MFCLADLKDLFWQLLCIICSSYLCVLHLHQWRPQLFTLFFIHILSLLIKCDSPALSLVFWLPLGNRMSRDASILLLSLVLKRTCLLLSVLLLICLCKEKDMVSGEWPKMYKAEIPVYPQTQEQILPMSTLHSHDDLNSVWEINALNFRVVCYILITNEYIIPFQTCRS